MLASVIFFATDFTCYLNLECILTSVKNVWSAAAATAARASSTTWATALWWKNSSTTIVRRQICSAQSDSERHKVEVSKKFNE
jgi:hypothetical protein